MFGRFRACDVGYVDALAAAKARNPHYREYPPGVANEHVDLPIVFGLIDFSLYVAAIYPLAIAYQACFFLWTLTIPFGFLSTVMPVGPASAWYWRRTHPAKPKAAPQVDLAALEQQLLAKRQWLHELSVQSVHVVAELTTELENAGDLRYAFEAQIRQARTTRSQLELEITKIDAQLATLRIESNRF